MNNGYKVLCVEKVEKKCGDAMINGKCVDTDEKAIHFAMVTKNYTVSGTLLERVPKNHTFKMTKEKFKEMLNTFDLSVL